MTNATTCARSMSSAKPRSTHRSQAALLVGPCDCPCVVEPLGVASSGSELGVDDAGVFLPLTNPLNVSASCPNTFFLGDAVLLEGFGVALWLPSVTSPSVGPEFDSGDTGAWVCDVPESDGACGGAGSVAPAAGGSLFTSDSCGS